MEVKWIKIVTDIFDDEKIKIIEAMPESDTIIVLWFKILCLAGKCNNGGVLMLNERIAYTDEMLAAIFRRPVATVRLALKTFEALDMVEIVENAVTIPNWSKHQSLDSLEKNRDGARKRMAAYRERQKQLAAGADTVTRNVTRNVTESDAPVTPIDIDIDIDKDIEKEKDIERERDTGGGGGDRVTLDNNIYSFNPTELKPDKLVVYAQDNLVGLSQNNLMELLSFRDSMTDDMIMWAIDAGCAHGVRSYGYIRAILNRMVAAGYKTLAEVKAAEEQRHTQKPQKPSGGWQWNDKPNPALNYIHGGIDLSKLGKDFYVDLGGDDDDDGSTEGDV